MAFDIIKADKIRDGEIPPFEIGTLEPVYTHQAVASSFLYEGGRCLNLDEMGVGKTIEALGAAWLESTESVVKAVVLTPSAVQHQWAAEVEKFLGWKTIVIEGSKAHRDNQYNYFNELSDNVVLITHYATPVKDEQHFVKLNATTLILDEVTMAKNPETKIHKLLQSVKYKYNRVYGFTGTPITLSLGDIYWIFTLLGVDGVVGSFEEEVLPYLETQTVSVKGRKFSSVVSATGFEELSAKLAPYIIRRTLAEVIPPETEHELGIISAQKPKLKVVPLNYDQHQQQVFQSLKQDANRLTKTGSYKPLEMYQNFLQAASSPALIREDYTFQSPKELWLLETLRSSNEKVVVFVRYLCYLYILERALKDNNFDYVTISGNETSEEKDIHKKEFIEHSSKRVMFITGAGKFGLNLQTATHLVFLDVPYNPADVLQYIGRVYRLGQMKDVTVSMVFLKNTLEEDNFRKLYKRQAVLDEFFDTEDAKMYKLEGSFVRGFLEKDYTKLE